MTKYRKWLIYTLIVGLVLTTSGCGPDFGQKVYDWVAGNARSYSERLTRADLKVRWLRAHNEAVKTLSSDLQKNEAILTGIAEKTKSFETRNLEGLEGILIRYDHSREMLESLIEAKSYLQHVQSLFILMDSIGSVHQFEEAGLRAVGKETLMKSFVEIGQANELINKARYERIFNLKYSIVLNDNGDVSGRAEPADGQSYSGSFEGFFASFFLTAPFYAWFIENDIQDQQKLIQQALDLFDVLSLKPHEQFIISGEYLAEAREKFAAYRQQLELRFTIQQEAWSTLYGLTLQRLKVSEIEITPYKLALAESDFRGSEDVTRILKEEKRTLIREKVVKMMGELVQLRLKVLEATPGIESIRLVEEYEDGLIEAEFTLNELLGKKELVAIYGDFERHLQRIQNYKSNLDDYYEQVKI